MSRTIQYIEEIKHFIDLTGTLCNTDCMFLLEDIKHDLGSLNYLPEDSNYFSWKLQDIYKKICIIQSNMPRDKENDFELF